MSVTLGPVTVGSLAERAARGEDRASRPAAELLRATDIHKAYGHVQALRGVNLSVDVGEIVGLVGDNGAGKSTLVKALTGSVRADRGTVEVHGRATRITSPSDARQLGIEVVYQDLALAPDLDPVANLFLGRERLLRSRRRLGTLDRRAMTAAAKELFAHVEFRLPSLGLPVRALSGGQRQLLAVIRAMAFARRLVFMDEPTAALGVRQTHQVNRLIREAADRGVAVVIVSHNLPELLEVVDRVVVLRLGRTVASYSASEATTERIVASMTGLSR
jgi:simple sugar transport system ATP-binding protein